MHERSEQMLAEADADARRAEREILWYAVRTVLLCLCWQTAGGAVVVYSFHAVMARGEATALMNAGIGIAAAGTLLTIALRHRRLGDGGAA